MTNQQGRVAVIDRGGWTKEYSLQKAIVHIGSDPRSDIVLEPGRGSGVAPRHAQLIAASGSGQDYRLVNLADSDIRLGPDHSQVLPPLSSMTLANGQHLTLGDFTLIFYGEQTGPAETMVGSRNIGLKISLPQAQLAPNRTLQGLITVSNRGERTGAQFYLELEGLDPACYRIEPGPVLSSGAEKEVTFQLQHQGHLPLAGEYELVIRAAAPGAYPAEQASVTQLIQVLPFYRHKMTLLGPDGAVMSPREQPLPGLETVVPIPAAPPQPAAMWNEAAASPEAEQHRVLKLKADQPPPVVEPPAPAGPPQPEPGPVELAQKPAPEDWWAAETAARPASASASWWEPRPATARPVKEDRVLKLKTASLPPVESPVAPVPAPVRSETWDIPPVEQAAPVVEPPLPPAIVVEPAARRPDVEAGSGPLAPQAEESPEPLGPAPEPAAPPGVESGISAAGQQAAPEIEPRVVELEAPEPAPAEESPAAAPAVVPEPGLPVEIEAVLPPEPEILPEPVPSWPALETLPAPAEMGEPALPPAEVKPGDHPAESPPAEPSSEVRPPVVDPAAADKPPEQAAPPARAERPRQETGDWWRGEAAEVVPDKTAAGVKPDLPRPALKLKAEETRPLEVDTPARAGRPRQGTEDWWLDGAPEEPAWSGPATGRLRPALKLKASSAPAEEQPEESSSGTATAAEDWWSPAGDSSR